MCPSSWINVEEGCRWQAESLSIAEAAKGYGAVCGQDWELNLPPEGQHQRVLPWPE